MNVALLEKIKKHILEEPRRLNMRYWIQRGTPGEYYGFGAYQYPPCGTAACIAGWAITLGEGNPRSVVVEDAAAKLLGINDDQAYRLFFVGNWSTENRKKYQLNYGKLDVLAAAAAAEIDLFIAEGTP